MRKAALLLMCTISMACSHAFAQGRPATMASILAEKKPRVLQLELLRAGVLCGPETACPMGDLRHEGWSRTDPCAHDVFGCHLAASFRNSGENRPWLFGGAKLSTTVGPVAFSIGRHRDNLAAARVPFVEGSYHLGAGSTVSFGVLRTRTDAVSRSIWYVSLRTNL